MSTARSSRRTLTAVFVLLIYGILTMWVPAFWAQASFQIGFFSLGIGWLAVTAFERYRLRMTPLLLPLFGTLLWPLLQLAANRTVYRLDTWNWFWTWVVNVLVFFLVFQAASDAQQLRRFLQAVLWFGFLLSGISTLQTFTSRGKVFWLFPSGYPDFVLGPFVYRNQYAACIELVLPLALFFALFHTKRRLGYAVMAAVMLASVIASASRAGTILVCAELLLVPLLAIRMRLLSGTAARSVLLRLLAFTTIAGIVVGFGLVWDRLLSPDPYFLRREVLISGLRMLRDRPGMGFGMGTWSAAYPGYAIFDPGATINQAHNDWLQWGIEGGIPFLLLMLAIAALLLPMALRSLWGIGLLFVLVHCLVDYPLQQRPAFAALFFAVAGAVATADAAPKQEGSANVQRPGVV